MRRRTILGIFLGLLTLLALAGWANRAALKRWAYEGSGRDAWQHPDQVLRALEILPGARVADIGSGSGYFTFRLAQAVGPTGRVYAVDIDPDMIRLVKQRAARESVANIESILAQPADPQLPADGVDLVFVCNTYHHIHNRVDYFRRVRGGLRPQGRLAIVELSHGGWLGKVLGHSTAHDVIVSELGAAGYRLEKQFGFLPRQHFLIFSVATEPDAKNPQGR